VPATIADCKRDHLLSDALQVQRQHDSMGYTHHCAGIYVVAILYIYSNDSSQRHFSACLTRSKLLTGQRYPRPRSGTAAAGAETAKSVIARSNRSRYRETSTACHLTAFHVILHCAPRINSVEQCVILDIQLTTARFLAYPL
jgi:hypothetical protein